MSALPPRQALVAFMGMLAGSKETGLIELRHRRSDHRGMRQRFFDARKPQVPAMAATALSRTGDVYVGCALRREHSGGKNAVQHGWTLWVDCDDPVAIAALERFAPQPPLVVRSSGRGLHAYWPLLEPLAAGELEQGNRRLAFALGADQCAVTNAAAVLRPPATLNYKYEPPAPVTLERYTAERLDAAQVLGDLPDPPTVGGRTGRKTPTQASRGEDPLLMIEPAVYIERLTGRKVGRDRKVECPFHPDAVPSLHAYPDPARGWACFSAKCWRTNRPNGGDIYDLAGQLWLTGQSSSGGGRRPLRGREFIEVRKRLLAMFFGDRAAGA